MQEVATIKVDAKHMPEVKKIIQELNGVYTPLNTIKEKILDALDDGFLVKQVENALNLNESVIFVDNIDEF